MKKFDEYFNEQMKNDEFAAEYNALEPEYEMISALIEARLSKKMTQKELADRCGVNQSDISRIEGGIRNPSIKLLRRIAAGMDMSLKIEFVPNSLK